MGVKLETVSVSVFSLRCLWTSFDTYQGHSTHQWDCPDEGNVAAGDALDSRQWLGIKEARWWWRKMAFGAAAYCQIPLHGECHFRYRYKSPLVSVHREGPQERHLPRVSTEALAVPSRTSVFIRHIRSPSCQGYWCHSEYSSSGRPERARQNKEGRENKNESVSGEWKQTEALSRRFSK